VGFLRTYARIGKVAHGRVLSERSTDWLDHPESWRPVSARHTRSVYILVAIDIWFWTLAGSLYLWSILEGFAARGAGLALVVLLWLWPTLPVPDLVCNIFLYFYRDTFGATAKSNYYSYSNILMMTVVLFWDLIWPIGSRVV